MAAAAETVGGTLGSLMARVDSWMAQRDQLVSDLRSMADNIASGGKAVIGGALKAAAAAPAAAKTRKRPNMSAEARAKIAAAQRKRWAKQKAEAKKSAKKAAKTGGASSNG